MKTVTGRITSFDGGYYFFGESSSYHSENAVAYTLEDDNGHSTVNVVSNYYNPDSVSRESGESNETVVFNNARNGKFAMTNDILGLAFTEDGVLYTANGYRQNYKNRQFPKEEGEKISEAPFEIIGDIQNGTALIGYRASVDGSQNIKGFIRNYSNSKWYRAEMTDVAANANVGYFGGAFFKNDEPMLIYTVQEYSINNDEGSSGKYEDGISDLYIQAGEVNSHVSAVSAEVTNLHDLGKDNTPAKVSTLVQNNGIQPVNKITAYTKKAGEPDTAYQIAEEYDIETLYPGQSREITFDLSGDFGDPTKYIVGVTTRSEKESGNRMQSTTVLDIPEGDLVITDADYAYRNLSHDRYRVTATMAGPGQKSGTIVFYNTETKEVYKSVPLENVKSGQTVTAELINEKGYLSSVYSHLGAAILTGEESIDTIQPSPDDQEVKLIPKWFMTSSNESDGNSCPRDDRCPMAPFTDVDSQAWYHNGVHWAIEKGIMDGTGEKVFEPMNSSSRAMMVTILWRMEGSPVVTIISRLKT